MLLLTPHRFARRVGIWKQEVSQRGYFHQTLFTWWTVWTSVIRRHDARWQHPRDSHKHHKNRCIVGLHLKTNHSRTIRDAVRRLEIISRSLGPYRLHRKDTRLLHLCHRRSMGLRYLGCAIHPEALRLPGPTTPPSVPVDIADILALIFRYQGHKAVRQLHPSTLLRRSPMRLRKLPVVTTSILTLILRFRSRESAHPSYPKTSLRKLQPCIIHVTVTHC